MSLSFTEGDWMSQAERWPTLNLPAGSGLQWGSFTANRAHLGFLLSKHRLRSYTYRNRTQGWSAVPNVVLISYHRKTLSRKYWLTSLDDPDVSETVKAIWLDDLFMVSLHIKERQKTKIRMAMGLKTWKGEKEHLKSQSLMSEWLMGLGVLTDIRL